MSASIVIGSRGSRLALAQAEWVADHLRAEVDGLEVRIEIIHTKGDKILDTPLSQIGGKGIFTKELEVALLDGAIDCAVHSLKDLPTELPDGLALAAIPKRANARDVLVTAAGISLADMPQRARIGTSSLRRTAQLRAYRPDLDVTNLRGNVETRIARVHEGVVEGAVLAMAGLDRLGLHGIEHVVLDESIMVPAAGQGALGIEVRANDAAAREYFAQIHDPRADAEVRAERTCLAELEGGCQVPLGIHAVAHGDSLRLAARIASIDGKVTIDCELEGATDDPEALGRAAAADLRASGAARLIEALR